MKTLRSWMLPVLLAGAVTGSAQTTQPRATGQTTGSAPSAVQAQGTSGTYGNNAGTQGATGRVAGASGAGTRPVSGTALGQGSSAAARTGITGVPQYRAGFRGGQGTPAPAETAQVTVTGDNDGDGRADRPAPSAALDGVRLHENSLGIRSGTPISVKLQAAVDSGHAKNGDVVRASLTAPAGNAPAGSPVEMTVVAAAPAGMISSSGELSLQVTRINGEPALSEVITAEGKEGAKILPDDAPGRGTEAIFNADQPLTLPAA